ncbi:MAG TPA: hypothetical protein DCY94_04520 [Firmicutes bacterium]|nr:hypothetical protein [Bacillota bacterium]
MTIKLKLFMICMCLIFALFIYRKVEKGNLQLRYSLAWYTIIFALMVVTVFDSLLVPLRNFFGFETISNMVFLVGFMILAMLIFSLNIKLSELHSKMVKLTQEIAILKKESTSHEEHKKTSKKL